MIEGRSAIFIAPAAYPLGGVADWLDYTLAGLEDYGMRCTLALVEGGGHDPDAYLRRHPYEQVVRVRNATGSREGRIRALTAVIERTAPDLVACVNIVDTYEAVRRIRARRTGTCPRVVMTLHGLQADLLADIGIHADVLDGVVGTNRLTVRIAADRLGEASRLHYAPYGVRRREPGSWPERRNRYPELRLLYAGRVEQEQKRVFDLVPILQRLRDLGVKARLSIAGGGSMKARLRDLFGNHGLADAVAWLGELDANGLAEAYLSHDLLLITSQWETGPIVAWEAMSHGLPVVSTRYVGSGLEDALREGRTALLFEIGHIEGAVASVLRLQDHGVRHSIVAGGHQLVSERYSREASIEAWCRAFGEVLKSPRRDPAPPRASGATGRLDRWLGVERAEDMRRLIGIRFMPNSPGSAWPHTDSFGLDEAHFLRAAAVIDQGASVRVASS